MLKKRKRNVSKQITLLNSGTKPDQQTSKALSQSGFGLYANGSKELMCML
jgi:hypothetical protein